MLPAKSLLLLIGRCSGLEHITYHLLHLLQSQMGRGWSELLQQEVCELRADGKLSSKQELTKIKYEKKQNWENTVFFHLFREIEPKGKKSANGGTTTTMIIIIMATMMQLFYLCSPPLLLLIGRHDADVMQEDSQWAH